MGKPQKPSVKTGTNRGRRVHWVQCPRCGDGREHVAKAGANKELKDHNCDG